MTRHTSKSVLAALVFLALGTAGMTLCFSSSEAVAAAKTDYPTKPVSMVVPFQAGGGTASRYLTSQIFVIGIGGQGVGDGGGVGVT